MEREGEDELGQGPWEEGGESVFFAFQWICEEALPQTSVELSIGSGASLLGFESELSHLLGQITLLLKNL